MVFSKKKTTIFLLSEVTESENKVPCHHHIVLAYPELPRPKLTDSKDLNSVSFTYYIYTRYW